MYRKDIFQVQAQLKLFNAQYCDLVAWREGEVFVQRVLRDEPYNNNSFGKIFPAYQTSHTSE